MSLRLVSAMYSDFYPFENIKLFNEFEVAEHPDTLDGTKDVLVVWGGADIHPALYNKGRSPRSHAGERPSHRDLIEWQLMQRAALLGIPIIGVCRGAQMLCALAGGILAQHVDNHSGYHPVLTADGKRIVVNSIHHQLMVPDNTNHELIAWTPERMSEVYHDDITLMQVDRQLGDPEFIYFNDVKGIAIQWHPEMMELDAPANQFVLGYIEGKLNEQL